MNAPTLSRLVRGKTVRSTGYREELHVVALPRIETENVLTWLCKISPRSYPGSPGNSLQVCSAAQQEHARTDPAINIS